MNDFLTEDELKTIVNKTGEKNVLLGTIGNCGRLVDAIQNCVKAEDIETQQKKFQVVLSEAVDTFFMIQQIRSIHPALFDYMASQQVIKFYKKIES